ncbi:MAG: hypothetical protein QOI66_4903, partial [Myxococcales bacterium]|nr:hypothetical protein [Myxococcales bacterium]
DNDKVEGPAPISARLGEITGLLNRFAPMAGSAIDALLQQHGVASANLSLSSLVSTYADAGVSLPFRIARYDGTDVVVPMGQVELTTSVVTLAKRLVTDWGLVSVEQLVERLHSRGSAIEGSLIVRRILSCLPRLRWLDDERAWFSFQGEKSHLGLDVRKVFAIAKRVSLCELRLALLKGRPQVAQAPLRTLEGYLSKVSNCEVDGDWVRPRGPAAAPFLSVPERLVVGVLEQFGGEMPLGLLKEQVSLLPVAETALARIVKVSPLFMRTDGDRVRLVGLAGQAFQPRSRYNADRPMRPPTGIVPSGS